MTRSRPCVSTFEPITKGVVLLPARPRMSLLSLLGTGAMSGTTPGKLDPVTGFNLNHKLQVIAVSTLASLRHSYD